MHEYTWCPCACGGVVRIWGAAGIKPCCKPCWETFWEATVAHMSDEPYESREPVHSSQCLERQAVRADVEITQDREFYLIGADPVEAPRVAEEDQN